MAEWRCVDISKWVCICFILLGLDLREKSNFRRHFETDFSFGCVASISRWLAQDGGPAPRIVCPLWR